MPLGVEGPVDRRFESGRAHSHFGMSLHNLFMVNVNIRNHVWQLFCIEKPVSTLHRWIVKLTGIMKNALRDIKLDVGDKWLGDETVVKVNGQIRYLWNIMDFETRIHIVSLLTEGRGAEEALMIIKTAIQEAGKKPTKFVSDGLKSYGRA